MLDPKQRHQLLMADRTGDPAWIAATIDRLLASDPDVDLLEIEAALREAAARSYLIADGAGFCVLIGVQALDRRTGPAWSVAGTKQAGAGGRAD